MKRTGKIAASAAALMMVAGSAFAADVPQVVTPVAPPPPPAPTFDWAGAYVGAHVGDFLGPSPLNFGVHGGFNIVNGNLLYGVDARASAYCCGFVLYEAIVRARAGFLLGDRLLVFGAAGIGLSDFDFGVEFGGGVEYAIGSSLSLRAEVNALFDFGGGFGLEYPLFWSVGLTFHPGN